jgi:hypothetical protein
LSANETLLHSSFFAYTLVYAIYAITANVKVHHQRRRGFPLEVLPLLPTLLPEGVIVVFIYIYANNESTKTTKKYNQLYKELYFI